MIDTDNLPDDRIMFDAFAKAIQIFSNCKNFAITLFDP